MTAPVPMTMKVPTVIALLVLAATFRLFAEADPFADTGLESNRPERTIAEMPKSVAYTRVDATKHEYIVSGLYEGYAAKSEDLADAASAYKFLIPDALSLDLDFKTAKASFSTRRELSLSELAYAIDDMAKLGGDFPYWAELEARDIGPTKNFAQVRYSIEATNATAPPELAWFRLPRDRAFRTPIILGDSELGSLLAVPTTAFCMCHSRFNLRILDPEGRLIWEQKETAYGSVRIALGNDNDSATHKIWLTRDDHGKSATFLIREHFVEERKTPPDGQPDR